MMNQKYKKLSAAALCGVMVLGLAGCGKAENTEIAAEQPMPLAEDDADLAEVLQDSLGISQTEDSDKDETVYVVADASGNSQQIIVSEWLKNTEGQSEIQDVSNLQDISNVKGDETFTQDGSSVTWAADGNPIYYQGTTDAQLPVGVEISYYLDGNQVTADEIAGQSGEVTIRFDYVNNEKSGDVYTPFVMATGLILSDENFSNVSVENGKVISDGSRSIVVGVGVPGLQESLGLEDEDIELPDYCEVSATATDFSLDMTVTFATTGLLGAIDEDADFSDVEDTVNDLLDEYQDGVNALADGIVEYTDGVGQIKDGADQLNDGAKKLYSGSVTLGNGVESAKNGTSQIKSSFESGSFPDFASGWTAGAERRPEAGSSDYYYQ
jgi:putative membrane protein